MLASTEYHFPLVSTRMPGQLRERELLRGLVFSDFGLLGLELTDPTFLEPRLSVGFGVRIEVPNPERLLRPGQFVHARLSTRGTTEPIIAIPRKAVLQVEGEPSVFVQADKGRYVARPVELGRVAGDLVEVKRGLIEGERIVIEGGFVLKSELQR